MFAHHASVLVMCPRSLCPPHCSVKTKPPTPNGLQTPRPPTPVSSSSPYLPPVSALSLTVTHTWTLPEPDPALAAAHTQCSVRPCTASHRSFVSFVSPLSTLYSIELTKRRKYDGPRHPQSRRVHLGWNYLRNNLGDKKYIFIFIFR